MGSTAGKAVRLWPTSAARPKEDDIVHWEVVEHSDGANDLQKKSTTTACHMISTQKFIQIPPISLGQVELPNSIEYILNTRLLANRAPSLHHKWLSHAILRMFVEAK